MEYFIFKKSGQYPKAKYVLEILNSNYYFFVTTSRSQEECIELMKEKSKNYRTKTTRSYKIYKIVDKKKEVIFKGSIKAY